MDTLSTVPLPPSLVTDHSLDKLIVDAPFHKYPSCSYTVLPFVEESSSNGLIVEQW